MKLLHIVSTPRQQSNTLQISNAFLSVLQAKYDDLIVEEIDLFNHDIPAVVGDNIETKYTLMRGNPVAHTHVDAWGEIEAFIENFKSADLYLISTPMWNFSIPYALKYFIDAIVQPGYLFGYNEQGQPYGLLENKKMVCITSRGGDYSAGGPFHAYDFQEPYLRAIFGFVGITDIHFVNAQPMDITPELREAALATGIEAAMVLANSLDIEPTYLIGKDGQQTAVSV